MPGNTHDDRRAVAVRKPASGLPAPALPSARTGPPILGDGLETPRSSHC
jgi:hypothetical protein